MRAKLTSAAVAPRVALAVLPALLVLPLLSSPSVGLLDPPLCVAERQSLTVSRSAASPSTEAPDSGGVVVVDDGGTPASATVDIGDASGGSVVLGESGGIRATVDLEVSGEAGGTVNLGDGASTITTTPGETATSAITITNEDEIDTCPGVDLLLNVSQSSTGELRIPLAVVNSLSQTVTATVDLKVGSKHYPVRLGAVRPGETVAKVVTATAGVGDTTVSAALIAS